MTNPFYQIKSAQPFSFKDVSVTSRSLFWFYSHRVIIFIKWPFSHQCPFSKRIPKKQLYTTCSAPCDSQTLLATQNRVALFSHRTRYFSQKLVEIKTKLKGRLLIQMTSSSGEHYFISDGCEN